MSLIFSTILLFGKILKKIFICFNFSWEEPSPKLINCQIFGEYQSVNAYKTTGGMSPGGIPRGPHSPQRLVGEFNPVEKYE